MPNDAFGQHYATSKRFDDEVNQFELMDEAAKYYANILFPLGSLILKKPGKQLLYFWILILKVEDIKEELKKFLNALSEWKDWKNLIHWLKRP